jgi:hypothetical protein
MALAREDPDSHGDMNQNRDRSKPVSDFITTLHIAAHTQESCSSILYRSKDSLPQSHAVTCSTKSHPLELTCDPSTIEQNRPFTKEDISPSGNPGYRIPPFDTFRNAIKLPKRNGHRRSSKHTRSSCRLDGSIKDLPTMITSLQYRHRRWRNLAFVSQQFHEILLEVFNALQLRK